MRGRLLLLTLAALGAAGLAPARAAEPEGRSAAERGRDEDVILV